METSPTAEAGQTPDTGSDTPEWERLLAEAPDRWELNGDINTIAPWIGRWAKKKKLTAEVLRERGCYMIPAYRNIKDTDGAKTGERQWLPTKPPLLAWPGTRDRKLAGGQLQRRKRGPKDNGRYDMPGTSGAVNVGPDHHYGGPVILTESVTDAAAIDAAVAALAEWGDAPPIGPVVAAFGHSKLADAARRINSDYPGRGLVIVAQQDDGGDGLASSLTAASEHPRCDVVACPPGTDVGKLWERDDINTWADLDALLYRPDLAAEAEDDEAPICDESRSGLGKALATAGVDVRLNIRAAQEEWRTADRDWEPIDDYAAEHIRELVAETVERAVGHDKQGNPITAPWRLADNKWRNFCNALLFGRQVDPFREWLATECVKVPPLPADTDIITACGFDVDHGIYPADYVTWVGWLPLHAAVARALTPSQRVRADCMPILVGPIEIGKDTFYESHFGPEHRLDWYCGTLCWADTLKEKVEKSGGAVFTSAVEMSGADRADLNGMKSWMSTPVAKVRLAYARRALNHIIRSVMVGTSNDLQHLPNDPHGNRRHAPLVVNGLPQMTAMQASNWWDEHRLAAWHRALIEVRAGRSLANRPIALKEVQERLADIHAVVPDDELLMMERLDETRPYETAVRDLPYDAGVLARANDRDRGDRLDRLTEAAAKRALKKCGYEPHATAVRRDGAPARRLWHNPEYAPTRDTRDIRDTKKDQMDCAEDDEDARGAEYVPNERPSRLSLPSRETPLRPGGSTHTPPPGARGGDF